MNCAPASVVLIGCCKQIAAPVRNLKVVLHDTGWRYFGGVARDAQYMTRPVAEARTKALRIGRSNAVLNKERLPGGGLGHAQGERHYMKWLTGIHCRPAESRYYLWEFTGKSAHKQPYRYFCGAGVPISFSG